MLPNNVDELAKKYLIEELGLTKEQVEEAGANLIGFFDVLMRIDKRIKSTNV